jgi:hypothetical protein
METAKAGVVTIALIGLLSLVGYGLRCNPSLKSLSYAIPNYSACK